MFRNHSEKSINSILDYISTSKQMELLQNFYETTLDALRDAKVRGLFISYFYFLIELLIVTMIDLLIVTMIELLIVTMIEPLIVTKIDLLIGTMIDPSIDLSIVAFLFILQYLLLSLSVRLIFLLFLSLVLP